MKKNNISSVLKWILLFFGLLPLPLLAQYIEPYPINEGNGDKTFELKNYQESVRQFTALLEEEPENITYKYKLGRAHTYAQINQAKGLALLLLVEKNGGIEDKVAFKETLAMAYFKNYKFEEAIKIYSELIKLTSDEEKLKTLKEQINTCERAIQMVENPRDVSFENLGDRINSTAPDYLPFVSTDEGLLFFTTRRDGVVGNLYSYKGYKTADIYTSRHKRNNYSRARSVGSPNTYGNEETAGRSENGNYILYHVDSDDNFSDLFVSELGRRSYMAPKVIGSDEVNERSSEPGGSLSNDGNQLFFSSNREGGYGGYDIYVVNRLPNGDWAIPRNLGPPVNTEKDEMYPQLMDEGQTLYFSSNGHPGMGGLDLFSSTWDEAIKQWDTPRNMGYPISTVNDDQSICFAENKRYAYLAQSRPEGLGDLDIYRLTFNQMRPDYTLISGTVRNMDSSLVKVDVLVEVIDQKTEKLVGSYIMNKNTSTFYAILPPGNYRLEVLDTYGYEDYQQKFNLLSKNDFIPRKKLDIMLSSKKE